MKKNKGKEGMKCRQEGSGRGKWRKRGVYGALYHLWCTVVLRILFFIFLSFLSFFGYALLFTLNFIPF